MTYRPELTPRAQAQFHDLQRQPAVYEALVDLVVRLTESPWDAWAISPAGDEPELREAQFGRHGLLRFRVDEPAETLIISNIFWAG